MKLNLRKWVLGAAIALSPQLMNAQVDITADAADATIYSLGGDLAGVPVAPTAVTTNPLLFAGSLGKSWGVHDGNDRVATILPFQFPDVPAGKVVESATLKVHILGNDIADATYDIDVYALPARDAATVLVSDYFEGVYDTDANATAIQQSMFGLDKPVNPNVWPDNLGNPPVEIVMSADGGTSLAAFMNAQYTAGATSSKFFFVRLSGNKDDKTGYEGLQVEAAESATEAYRPMLTVTYKDAPVGNTPPVIEDIEDVVSSTLSSTSVPIAVSDVEDAENLLVISVKDASGAGVDGILIETHWSGTPHFVTIDGSKVPAGVYTVTVTDLDGASASKELNLTVEDATTTFVSGRNWPAAPITEETGVFTKSIKVIPNGSVLDAGVTMSEGELTPDSWGDCSAIVKLKPDGTFDAHDGSGYRADEIINYTAGVAYVFDFTVDVPNAKFSVSITEAGGSTVVLAKDYGFRNASVTKLDHMMLAGYMRSYTLDMDATLAIDDKEVSNLSIYPNPVVGGAFSIQLPEGGKNFDLQIMDLAGKSVYNSSFVKSSNVVNVSANLNAGIYIVKLSSEVSVSTQKLMVK